MADEKSVESREKRDEVAPLGMDELESKVGQRRSSLTGAISRAGSRFGSISSTARKSSGVQLDEIRPSTGQKSSRLGNRDWMTRLDGRTREQRLAWAEEFLAEFFSTPVPQPQPPRRFTKDKKYRSTMRDIKSTQVFLKNLAHVDARGVYGPIVRMNRRRRKSFSEYLTSLETEPKPLLEHQPRRLSALGSVRQPALRAAAARARPRAAEEELREAEREEQLHRWGIRDPAATALRLVGRPLQEKDFQILSELLELDHEYHLLDLSRCNLPDSAAGKLARALGKNSAAERVVLQHSTVTDAGIKQLAQMFALNDTIKVFDCRNCKKLTTAAGLHLFDGIMMNEGLEEVNGMDLQPLRDPEAESIALRSLALQDPEAALLARLLAAGKSQRLRAITLYNNKLGPQGARFLCPVLGECPALKELNLNKNKLTRHSLPFICAMVKNTSSLESLNLSNNELTDEGWNVGNVEALAKALLNNTTLTEIHLSGNWIPDRLLSEVEDKLRVNRALPHDQQAFSDFLEVKFNPQPAPGCLFDMNDPSLLSAVDRRFLAREGLTCRSARWGISEYTADYELPRVGRISDVTPPRTRRNSYDG